MRGKQIRLEEGNLNNLKSKYEDVKNDKLDLSVNTTQNRNKQRNVNILSNQCKTMIAFIRNEFFKFKYTSFIL